MVAALRTVDLEGMVSEAGVLQALGVPRTESEALHRRIYPPVAECLG